MANMMKPRLLAGALTVLTVVFAIRISAQAPSEEAWREAPPTSTGIDVGKPIPAFSVPDQNGQLRDFKSIVGPNGAMIVFQRSVDW